jgi:hypothetical protein
MGNLNRDLGPPGQDLNPGTPEYEAGVLTTRPRSLVETKQKQLTILAEMSKNNGLILNRSALFSTPDDQTRQFRVNKGPAFTRHIQIYCSACEEIKRESRREY